MELGYYNFKVCFFLRLSDRHLSLDQIDLEYFECQGPRGVVGIRAFFEIARNPTIPHHECGMELTM